MAAILESPEQLYGLVNVNYKIKLSPLPPRPSSVKKCDKPNSWFLVSINVRPTLFLHQPTGNTATPGWWRCRPSVRVATSRWRPSSKRSSALSSSSATIRWETHAVNLLRQRTLVSSGYLVKTHCDVKYLPRCLMIEFGYFSLLSTQGSAMLPAMPLDRWPQISPQPSRRNSMTRYQQSCVCEYRTFWPYLVVVVFWLSWSGCVMK